MCKSGLNCYFYCLFPSTTSCGKLVEKLSNLRKTFLGLSFPPLSTSSAGGRLAEKWKSILQISKNKQLTAMITSAYLWKRNRFIIATKSAN